MFFSCVSFFLCLVCLLVSIYICLSQHACMVQFRAAFSSLVVMTTAIRPIGSITLASTETLPIQKRVAVTQAQATRYRLMISHAEMKVLWRPCNRFSYLEA